MFGGGVLFVQEHESQHGVEEGGAHILLRFREIFPRLAHTLLPAQFRDLAHNSLDLQASQREQVNLVQLACSGSRHNTVGTPEEKG